MKRTQISKVNVHLLPVGAAGILDRRNIGLEGSGGISSGCCQFFPLL